MDVTLEDKPLPRDKLLDAPGKRQLMAAALRLSSTSWVWR
jgi:hypothetical protein